MLWPPRAGLVMVRPHRPFATEPQNMTIDTALQRLNMVESQVRPSDVTDRRILRAMSDVQREAFVPLVRRPVAYMDEAIPLGLGSRRVMLAPRVLAKLIQACVVEPKSVVLDVGCATGYSTAVLARIARKAIGLDSDGELVARAAKMLTEQGIANATVHQGPMAEGRQAEGPYDAILVNGAIEVEPKALLDQLKDGGRLVCLSAGTAGKAVVWTRTGRNYDRRDEFDAVAPVLPGFEAPRAFTL
jgi:protein-L-isoaspartate(D-aspartate) O-methyltransferase